MDRGNELPNTRLKRLREAKGLKQAQIAEYLGCTVKSYRDWETGKRNLSRADYLEGLADLYAVSTDYLLCRTDDLNIGNSEISEATGLSEDSIEYLRWLLREVHNPDNEGLSKIASNTIWFLNAVLSEEGEIIPKRFWTDGQGGMILYDLPLFSLLTEYVLSKGSVAVDERGKESISVQLRSASGSSMLHVHEVGRLLKESLISEIRERLELMTKHYEKERADNG